MALSFPSLPQLEDTSSSDGKTWKWNGLGWEKVLPARPFYGIASDYGWYLAANEIILMGRV